MYRVIIVDDEPLVRMGLRETIEWDELGLEISGEASNGIEALKLINNIRPEILITDIKMPNMNGLQLIKKIRELNYKIKIIVLSGYTDYEYLKEAIECGVESYLLKPIDNEELISIINSAVNNIEREILFETRQKEGTKALKRNILNRLVMNSISLKEFKEKSTFLNLSFKGNEFSIVIAAIEETGEDTDFIRQKHKKIVMFSDRCEKTMNVERYGVTFINEKGDFVLIANSCHNEKLKRLMADIVNMAQKDLNLAIFAGIGSGVRRVEDIHESYANALKCLDYGMILKRQRVIAYYDIEANGPENFENINFEYQIVENLIKTNKKDELEKYIDKIFNDMRLIENISIENIRNFIIQMAVYIITIIGGMSENTESIINKIDFRYAHITNIRSLREFELWIKDFCGNAVKLLNDNKNYVVSNMVKNTIDYINRYYFKQISLKLIANEIYINPSYLGQIFKKEVGESFTDYVNKYRVKKAKDLLDNTDMKIYEVAEKVGFTDARYFSKIFKKITRINPSDIKRAGI